MLRPIEGSAAVAHAVALCRPQVIAAYPITPQTHIVENLARLIADDLLRCELISVESESPRLQQRSAQRLRVRALTLQLQRRESF